MFELANQNIPFVFQYLTDVYVQHQNNNNIKLFAIFTGTLKTEYELKCIHEFFVAFAAI